MSKEKEYREIAEKLWQLLDDIDTASDMFKPCESNGIKSFENFYTYSLKKASKRFDYLKSDGFKNYDKEEWEAYVKVQEDKPKEMYYKVDGKKA